MTASLFGISGGVPGTNTSEFFVNVQDYPYLAQGNGITDDLAAFTAAYAAAVALGIPLYIPYTAAGYVLSANWVPPQATIDIDVAPGVKYIGHTPDFGVIIPWESTPSTSQHLSSKIYGTEYNSVINLFHRADFAKTTAAYPSHVVGHYSQGEAAGLNSHSFGSNPVGTASHATAVAIGSEIDSVVTVSGGTAYTLVLASTSWPGIAANFPNAIQVSSNGFTSHFGDGILFQFSDTVVDGGPRGCYDNAGISWTGGGGAGSVCQTFLRSSGVSTTQSTIDFPSFLVDAYDATTVKNRVEISSGTIGVGPRIRAAGSDANIDLVIFPKGTGSVTLTDNALNTKLAVNSVGIGLFGNAPVAKLAGWGVPTGAAVVANFPGATATLLQTSTVVAEIIAYLKLLGPFGA